MKKSIKDSIYVDISKAISDALWNEINKWYRQKNIPQLLKDVREALEEYDELLDDKDRLEFEEWIADVEDDLNSPHIEDSVDFDPEDYESFKVVNKTSLDNKQYAMIQAKATDQNKPDVFYISSSPDMQPENDRRIYVTRADAEREFDQIKAKADKRRKDSMPSIEKIKSATFEMDPDSELTDDDMTNDKELFELFHRLAEKIQSGNYQYEESTGDAFVLGDSTSGKYSMILWYNEEDDPKKIFITAGINQDENLFEDSKKKDSMPALRLPTATRLKENMKRCSNRLMRGSDVTWEDLDVNKGLRDFYDRLHDRFRELGYANDMNDNGIMSITEEDAGYRITLYYDVTEGDSGSIDALIKKADGSAEVQDAEPVDYFIADYKGTKPQNKHEEEVLDELIRTIITDKGEAQGSGEWTYVDQGPVQGAIIYTAAIEYKTDENNQFEVIVKKFDVEYDSDY